MKWNKIGIAAGAVFLLVAMTYAVSACPMEWRGYGMHTNGMSMPTSMSWWGGFPWMPPVNQNNVGDNGYQQSNSRTPYNYYGGWYRMGCW